MRTLESIIGWLAIDVPVVLLQIEIGLLIALAYLVCIRLALSAYILLLRHKLRQLEV